MAIFTLTTQCTSPVEQFATREVIKLRQRPRNDCIWTIGFKTGEDAPSNFSYLLSLLYVRQLLSRIDTFVSILHCRI